MKMHTVQRIWKNKYKTEDTLSEKKTECNLIVTPFHYVRKHFGIILIILCRLYTNLFFIVRNHTARF